MPNSIVRAFVLRLLILHTFSCVSHFLCYLTLSFLTLSFLPLYSHTFVSHAFRRSPRRTLFIFATFAFLSTPHSLLCVTPIITSHIFVWILLPKRAQSIRHLKHTESLFYSLRFPLVIRPWDCWDSAGKIRPVKLEFLLLISLDLKFLNISSVLKSQRMKICTV